MRALLLLGALGAFGLCSAGHSSDATAVDSGPMAAKAASKSARATLVIGMSAEEVRTIIGKPKRVKAMKQDGVVAEVWLYSYNTPTGVRQIATSMRDVPFIDPLTGVLRMIQEPVYSHQMTYVVETTELLMVDGALANSKRYRTVKRHFD